MIARKAIIDLVSRIVAEFNPQKVILFGSYASGTPRPDSDVDLLVILPFKERPFRKSLEILNRTDPAFPVDLLARTARDTQRRYRQGDPLVQDALDRGQVLYERRG